MFAQSIMLSLARQSYKLIRKLNRKINRATDTGKKQRYN